MIIPNIKELLGPDLSANIIAEVRKKLLDHLIYALRSKKRYEASVPKDEWSAEVSNLLDALVDRALSEYDLFEANYGK